MCQFNTVTDGKFGGPSCIARLPELYDDSSGHSAVRRLSCMCDDVNLIFESLLCLQACVSANNDSTPVSLTHFDGTTLIATLRLPKAMGKYSPLGGNSFTGQMHKML